MILARFEHGGSARVGLVFPEKGVVADYSAVNAMANLSAEESCSSSDAMMDIIVRGDEFISEAQPFLDEHIETIVEKAIALEEVRFLPPLLKPARNIFCVGLNYVDHIKEGDSAQKIKRDLPDVPQFFTKPYTTIIGNGEDIPNHSDATERLDYEGELAVVIGKRGINISREDALMHIFGFSIINDISARDLQRRHGQWFKGKALDGTCPFGPWIVHRKALSGYSDAFVRTRVNGELRQDSRTSAMIFDIPTIIEELSRGMALEPGDVIATGTPAGVGYAMSPPKFLKPGDVVEVEIEGIGVLKNQIALS